MLRLAAWWEVEIVHCTGNLVPARTSHQAFLKGPDRKPTRAAVRSNAAVSSIAASAEFQARAWTLSEWCFRVAWHCAVFRSQILADASADALASTLGAAGFQARPRTASVWLPGCNAYTAGATSAGCSMKESYHEKPGLHHDMLCQRTCTARIHSAGSSSGLKVIAQSLPERLHCGSCSKVGICFAQAKHSMANAGNEQMCACTQAGHDFAHPCTLLWSKQLPQVSVACMLPPLQPRS